MKIASKVPATTKAPVYVTKDEYAIWYSKPVCLGHVKKHGDYWYTADGLRFASSRDAMNYLIRLTDVTGLVPATGSMGGTELRTAREPSKTAEAHTEKKAPIVLKKKEIVKPAEPATKRKGAEPVRQESQVNQPSGRVDNPINQNHPKFQEYLDFVDFMARRRVRAEGFTSSHGDSLKGA